MEEKQKDCVPSAAVARFDKCFPTADKAYRGAYDSLECHRVQGNPVLKATSVFFSIYFISRLFFYFSSYLFFLPVLFQTSFFYYLALFLFYLCARKEDE